MIPLNFDKSKIPHKPGIYIYKNSLGHVIYVGKAVDLYSRVSSYFSRGAMDAKTASLVTQITGLETIIVESELEALILEANLIKKYLPQYNIRLTDDKDYLYIAVTNEEFPKVITARKKDLKPVKWWFGPFPSATTVKSTLKQLRRVFPWCSNPPKNVIPVNVMQPESGSWGRGLPRMTGVRACFYYHLNLCPGACVGTINKADYNKIIMRFKKFMEGKKVELVGELAKEMEDYAKNMRFEDAERVKKTLLGIEYLTQTNRVSRYLENPNFLQDERQKSLEQLQADLNLPGFPERIEAYDISNFAGKEATGSMVVLTNGEIDKSQYRRFKIRISGKPNDVGMHKEMMTRRLNHPEWPLPQLMLIDGGRGQAVAIATVCNRKGVRVPVFGLAKRMEWLYPPEGEIIKLPKRSLSLRLLQKIRDESHRFAINYHRKLRKNAYGIGV